MKVDKVIKRRFEELAVKSTVVDLTRMPLEKTAYVDRELFHEWATGVLSLLRLVFGENGPHYSIFYEFYKSSSAAFYPDFKKCKGVFQAAKEDYESGYLFSMRGLIKAEDSVDVLEQATEFLKSGYKDVACVIAGVALEIALKELIVRNQLPHGKLNAMNMELRKNNVYNLGMQQQITTWAHWRNKAAHGEWGEYVAADVEDMIRGVKRFVADYL